MMYGFGIWSVVSSIISAVLGGGMVWIFAMKAQKKRLNAEAKGAEATAESTELNNVEKAITIWREMAESLQKELTTSRAKYEEVTTLVNKLQKSVDRLNCINGKIERLLDKISHDNLEKTVAEIKEEIKKADA